MPADTPLWTYLPLKYDHKVTKILLTDTYRRLPKNTSWPLNARSATSSDLSIGLRPSAHPGTAIKRPLHPPALVSSVNPSSQSRCSPPSHRGAQGFNNLQQGQHLTKILHPQLGLKQNHIINLSQYCWASSKWGLLINYVLQNCLANRNYHFKVKF